jgi:hypothetical protein
MIRGRVKCRPPTLLKLTGITADDYERACTYLCESILFAGFTAPNGDKNFQMSLSTATHNRVIGFVVMVLVVPRAGFILLGTGRFGTLFQDTLTI